jgi:hypothetical protein
MAAQLCGLSFDLNDVLLADLLREYLRPKEEPLSLVDSFIVLLSLLLHRSRSTRAALAPSAG